MMVGRDSEEPGWSAWARRTAEVSILIMLCGCPYRLGLQVTGGFRTRIREKGGMMELGGQKTRCRQWLCLAGTCLHLRVHSPHPQEL